LGYLTNQATFHRLYWYLSSVPVILGPLSTLAMNYHTSSLPSSIDKYIATLSKTVRL